jgi:chromosome segregation ATPase
MDINQAAQMIEWLDEERRRDKSNIATLEERLAQQQQVIDTLQKRLSGLESDHTVMRTELSPSVRDGDLMEQMRNEARQMIEAAENKRLTSEREAERRAELNREQLARPVRELSDKVTKIERQTTEVPGMQVERDRLTTSVATVQQRVDDLIKKMEEPDRRLAFLEEQRRQDARRISELETETPEIQKQVDSVRPKLTLIEDLTLRNERRIQEMQNSERERREQIQQFIDQQNLQIQQRDLQIEQLMERFGEHDSAMERNIERFEAWSEAYRNMKQIIDDFHRIGDRLERRINEVAEAQRLSEDRFRQEWNDWRADDQKRWKQFTLSNDEVWRSHDKEFERFVQRLDDLNDTFSPLQESLERLWKLERERARLYQERYQALLLEFDQPGGGSGPSITSTGTVPAVPSDGGNGTS